MYKATDISSFDYKQFAPNIQNISMNEILEKLSHKKNDMIVE